MALAEDDDRHVEHGEARPPGRGWTGWLSAGCFVLGLVTGVLLLGLLGQDAPAGTTAEAPGTASRPVDPSSAPGAPTGRVEVNAACLRALNAAQDIAASVEDLGTAAAALDAAQLDEVVRRLQPLQARLQDSTAACEVTGSSPAEGAGPAGSATPAPTASPSD